MAGPDIVKEPGIDETGFASLFVTAPDCLRLHVRRYGDRGRVKQWIEKYGDPRDPNVDPIDWVERIPFSETRNYVQRVIENMQVYRAQLTHGRLMIEADLRRGAATN